jgi:cytochrome P450
VGIETIASTLEWALLQLIRQLDIMKKTQEETDKVVGRNRPMFELDLPNLPYLQAIIK